MPFCGEIFYCILRDSVPLSLSLEVVLFSYNGFDNNWLSLYRFLLFCFPESQESDHDDKSLGGTGKPFISYLIKLLYLCYTKLPLVIGN